MEGNGMSEFHAFTILFDIQKIFSHSANKLLFLNRFFCFRYEKGNLHVAAKEREMKNEIYRVYFYDLKRPIKQKIQRDFNVDKTYLNYAILIISMHVYVYVLIEANLIHFKLLRIFEISSANR